VVNFNSPSPEESIESSEIKPIVFVEERIRVVWMLALSICTVAEDPDIWIPVTLPLLERSSTNLLSEMSGGSFSIFNPITAILYPFLNEQFEIKKIMPGNLRLINLWI
jgi:hypothetical protein